MLCTKHDDFMLKSTQRTQHDINTHYSALQIIPPGSVKPILVDRNMFCVWSYTEVPAPPS